MLNTNSLKKGSKMEFSKLYRIMEANPAMGGAVNPAMGAKPSDNSGLTLAPYGDARGAKPSAGGQMAGSLNLQKLLPYFPSSDTAIVKRSVGIVMKGGESKLTTIQLMNLGKAFVDLLKADATKTVQIMNLLKKVSQEEPDTEL